MPKEKWVQVFCLLMTTTETQTWDGDLVALAGERWEQSPGTDPENAIQLVLIEREL